MEQNQENSNNNNNNTKNDEFKARPYQVNRF